MSQKGKGVQAFMQMTVAHALACFPAGWFLMLGVGVIHGGWFKAMPTLGFWTSWLIVFFLKQAIYRMYEPLPIPFLSRNRHE